MHANAAGRKTASAALAKTEEEWQERASAFLESRLEENTAGKGGFGKVTPIKTGRRKAG